ncbi:unnamed protein product [Ambrosiozyma monospora]|uniref:Unnamed protein product n=1 Tax=Ambrosiozyma monospora TaxID=43982 RepID=A0A9W6YNR0_AMBMO|nr:unnamed protein product [Ambrosiozyma monospora]
MRNPPSLLLLWSIFYFSATIVAKTPEQKRLSRTYYQRAKVLADVTFESDSIYYILSLYILSIKPPGSTQSIVSLDERIRRVIKFAIGFGMNTDPQHTPYFNDNQRKLCKRLFWQIHARDRYFAVCLSSSYILSETCYNVPRLQWDDFTDMDPESAKICYKKAKVTDLLHDFMIDLNKIQKNANNAYLEDKPFRHFEKEADQVCLNMKAKLTEMFKGPTESYFGFLTFLIYYTIEVYIMRVNIYRLYYSVLRCLKREQTTPGILETYNFPESQENVESIDYFDRIIEAVHSVTDVFVKCFPLYKDKMVFSQLSVFLGYQMGIFLSFFSYSDDPVKSQLMKDDIKRLYPVLEENLDLVSWGLSDFAFVYFKGLLENPDFAAEFMRSWMMFKDNSILLRIAYRIPKLRIYAKKAMGCFSSALDENFEGSYKGIIFIDTNKEKQLQHQTPIETIKNPSFQSLPVDSSCNNSNDITSILGTSFQSPKNISRGNIPHANNIPNIKLEPNNVVSPNHHPSPPANVIPSINSIINHSMLPMDLPNIDLPLQSYLNMKSIGTEYEVMNTINSLHQHNGPAPPNQTNNPANNTGNFASTTNLASVTASNYELAISSSHAPYSSNVPPGSTMDSSISSISSWLKSTTGDWLKTSGDDWFHKDIQVGQLLLGNSGNAEICQTSKNDYGWLVDEVKDDYGILDSLKYVGDDDHHHVFEQFDGGFNV